MEHAKHTRTPWEIMVEESPALYDEGTEITVHVGYDDHKPGGMLAHACQVLSDGTTGQLMANARLIAAAPELLEALKELVAADTRDDADTLEHDLDGHDVEDCCLCMARAAIAKAEGRQ